MVRIVSTVGQDLYFCFYEKEKKGSKATIARLRKDAQGKPIKIKIAGGAGVLAPDNSGRIKRYEITTVTDEVCALLNTDETYKRMKLRGFITEHQESDEITRAKTGQPADMERRDNCAQINDHEHAQGLDDRISHGGTRAAAGPHDADKGEQPLSAYDGEYGSINI